MKNFLKFWGTRGSCSVSGPDYAKYGGNTCCLEIHYEGTHLIFDAGTGIRPLGDELSSRGVKKVNLLLSHTHWDHLIGFPFFGPLFQKDVEITIHAPLGTSRGCREVFDQLLAPAFFPVHLDQVQAHLDFRTCHAKTPIQMGDVVIDFHRVVHPGVTLCFKIQTPNQTIGYITDNELLLGYHGSLAHVPSQVLEPYQSFIDFFQGCDILIHEAQYTPEEYLHRVGWGHSSIQNVAYLLKKIKCPRWIVTHHDPAHTDAHLDALMRNGLALLKEHKIDCTVEWASDMDEVLL